MDNQIDLAKYIKYGEWEIHNDTLYDIKSLIMDNSNVDEVCKQIPMDVNTLVGVDGSASMIATCRTVALNKTKTLAYIKGDVLKGNVVGDYCLIDDVVTTETSIRKNIEIIGKPPKYIFCIVDKRIFPGLKIKSMFKIC